MQEMPMLRRGMLLPVLGAALLSLGCQSDSADTSDIDTNAATLPADTSRPMTVGAATGQELMYDPNSASREELMTAGLSGSAADALIAGRPYDNMLEADTVLAPLLSAEQRADVYARVWRPIDLNTASEAEILLIPGVGPRMQHEFEEYRPYRGIEQFRREIGKYVDSAEVARLERYVTIR
jgi:DNA uptake protein ComE-like DNA-binding protein